MSAGLSVGLGLCFYCNEANSVLIDRRIRANPVDLGQGVYDMEPCDTCKGYMGQGIIVITIKDGEAVRVEKERKDHVAEQALRGRGLAKAPFIPNPYRTGSFTVVTEEGFRRMSEGLGFPPATLERVLQCRWTFMEDSVAELSGLYEQMERSQGQVSYFRKQCREAGKDPHAEALRLAGIELPGKGESQ